jgi:FMN-dependent NADH-azoreductase
MQTLLHLDSSITGTSSATRQLTAAIVADHLAHHPHTQVVYRDLDAQPVPHLSASILSGNDVDGAQLGAQLLSQFQAADVVVIGAPMYNFAVPSTLKAWIDRIAVAGQTFRYTPEGPQGLAGDKTVIVASARGSALGDAAAADFQEAYLRQLFGFLGVTRLRIVRAEGLALSPQHRAQALQQALAHVPVAAPSVVVVQAA